MFEIAHEGRLVKQNVFTSAVSQDRQGFLTHIPSDDDTMTQPKKSIAVCVITYNQRDYLIELIDSILAQTRMPDQIVIVDDASPDDSADVLRQYERDHPGLFTIKLNETNLGISANRHFAIQQSRCDLTTYADGDDLYYPEKLRLEEQCLLDNPDAGFVYSNMNMIDENSKVIRPWTTKPEELPTGNIFESVVAHEFPGQIHCRFLLTDTESLVEATKHSQSFTLYEDLAVYMHLSSFMKCAVVNEINHGYRQHAKGMHRTHRETHFIGLQEVKEYFHHLFVQLEPRERKRIEKKCNHVMAGYAWRAIKDHYRSPTELSKKRVIILAKDAIRLRPSSVRPKHALRILATQLKSAR